MRSANAGAAPPVAESGLQYRSWKAHQFSCARSSDESARSAATWLVSIAPRGSIDQSKTAVNRACGAKTVALDPDGPTKVPRPLGEEIIGKITAFPIRRTLVSKIRIWQGMLGQYCCPTWRHPYDGHGRLCHPARVGSAYGATGRYTAAKCRSAVALGPWRSLARRMRVCPREARITMGAKPAGGTE